MDIQALQLTLREFAAQRHWQTFHTPKNLSTALMVEAAELLEIFQWMTPEESQVAHLDPDRKERIADEVADVLLYLLQVADHCNIDIPTAVANKLLKNATKYPAAQQAAESMPSPAIVPALPLVADPTATAPQGSTDQPAVFESPAPQTHVLVDWENVQPKALDIQTLVPSVTDVWLFHGPNQKNVAADQTSFGQRATLVPIARTGKNALDFHLSFYMGYIASRNPQGNMVVISNDKGYLPMLEHAQTLGFSVRQVGFEKVEATKKPTPRKVPAKPKVTVIVAPASALEAEVTAKVMAEVVPMSEQKRGSQAQKTKPVKQAVRQTSLANQVAMPASPSKASQTHQLALPQPGTTTLPTPPAKAARKTGAAKKAPTAKKAPIPSKGTAKTEKIAPKQAKPKVATKPAAKKAAAKKTPLTRPLPKKQVTQLVSADLTKAVRHVQTSLQKMAGKPTRKAGLLATIQSLLNLSATEAHIVPEVLAQLVDQGFIVVSENGAVGFSA